MGKKLDETTGALHDFAHRVFQRATQLTGSEPVFYSNGWYKFTDQTTFLFCRLNGDPTKAKVPPNSVELQAFWNEEWKGHEGVQENPKAFWGNTSAAEVCFLAQPEFIEKAIAFIDAALEFHRRRKKG